MTRIGKNYILKCVFNDSTITYYAKSKNYEYAMDPSNATLFKTKKQAENKKKKLEKENASLWCIVVKEVQLMLIP